VLLGSKQEPDAGNVVLQAIYTIIDTGRNGS
jgi:hypothetical protein